MKMASADNLCSNTIYQIKNGKYKSWTAGMYVRKFAPIESMYAKVLKYGSENTVQAIWLNSKIPIITKDVENALYMIAEKYPPLQLCAVQRLGTHWFKVMDEVKIDFEESTADPMDVYQNLLATSYDMKHGPLWKARLVLPENYEEGTLTVLIFSIHHTITDAWTNTVYCREVVEFLNKKVSNDKTAFERIPLARRVDKNTKVSTKSMVNFYRKISGTKIRHAFRHDFPKKSFLFKNLTPSKPEIPQTKVLTAELTEGETTAILKLCKQNNITVNSFMVTLSNFALVDSVDEKKKSKSKHHEVLVAQIVDMRRYYKPENRESIGCHVGVFETRSKTPVQGLSEFWKHADALHQDVKKKLDKNFAAKLSTLLSFYPALFRVNKLLTDLNQPTLSDYHYCSTNMGNITKLFGEENNSDNVKIGTFLRSVSREYGGCIFNFTFHTYKNRMLISIDYYTNKISGSDINRYFTYFMNYLRNANSLIPPREE